MAHYLSVIRDFLELNPGNVIVLFDEDYVFRAQPEKRVQAGRAAEPAGQAPAGPAAADARPT